MSKKLIKLAVIVQLVFANYAISRPLLAKKEKIAKPSKVIENAHGGGSVVAFNAQSTQLASGGWAGQVKLWAVPSGNLNKSWQAHTDTVNGIFYRKDGKLLVTAGYDGYIRLWTSQGELKKQINAGSPIMHMRGSWKLNRLITGHKDGRVKVWNLKKLTIEYEKRLHKKAIRAVAINDKKALFASSSHDGRVYVWTKYKPAFIMAKPPTDSRTLEFSRDGKELIGGGWFKIYRWKIKTGVLTSKWTRHWGIIKSMQLSNDGKSLATISRQTDSSVYILDSKTFRVKRRLQSHKLCGAYIQFSPDNQFVATTSDDASVNIFNLKRSDYKKPISMKIQ